MRGVSGFMAVFLLLTGIIVTTMTVGIEPRPPPATATPTYTATPTATFTPTATPTFTPTATPTDTPPPTATYTPVPPPPPPPPPSGLNWPTSIRAGGGFGGGHDGIDILAPYGAEVRAAHSGTMSTHYEPGYGNYIIVRSGRFTTLYAHLSAFHEAGQVVAGQLIGHVGCTGRCFGPHVHFELRVDGALVNPLNYLP